MSEERAHRADEMIAEAAPSGQSAGQSEERAEIPFERKIALLEEIVARLERGDVPLADSLSLFEEGTKLIAACSRQLDQAEQQVVKLMKGQDGAPVELPFEDTAEM